MALKPARPWPILIGMCLTMARCAGGGSNGTPTPITPTPPGAPAPLTVNVVTAADRTRVRFTWPAATNADDYLLEVGTGTGLADALVVAVRAPEFSWNTPLDQYLYGRVKARSAAGTSGSSNEVRVAPRTLRDSIDALLLGAGPLAPSDGALACVTPGAWVAWRNNATIRVRASTSIRPTMYANLQAGIDQIIEATAGQASATLGFTEESDPVALDGEITMTVVDDARTKGCSFSRGCVQITVRDSLMTRASVYLGPEVNRVPAAYVHELGHGVLGMCHIDAERAGGAWRSLMSGGARGFTCTPPSDTCVAENFTPMDIAAAQAIYTSGLARGTTRSAFQAAGLVNDLAASPSADLQSAYVRRERISENETRVTIDEPPPQLR